MSDVSGLSVAIDDDGPDPVRVDPITGTVEHDQADGSVIVELDKVRRDREIRDQTLRTATICEISPRYRGWSLDGH